METLQDTDVGNKLLVVKCEPDQPTSNENEQPCDQLKSQDDQIDQSNDVCETKEGTLMEGQSSCEAKDGKIGQSTDEAKAANIGTEDRSCETNEPMAATVKSETEEATTEKIDSSDDNATVSMETGGESSAALDPYAYVKREGFTSEIFKIEIQNLPKRYGIGQLKKRLISQKLNPIKLKTPNNGNYAFVTFRSEEEREQALKVLEGHVWKGKAFKVKKAHPAADPLLKRKLQAASDSPREDKRPRLSDDSEDLSIEDRLKNAVTPLWKIPYEDQLKTKENTVCDFMKKLTREAEKNNPNLRRWLAQQKNKFKGSCCEVLPIKKSPVLDGYRNKCEFTIARNMEGKDKVVGFRLGSYRDGVCVAEPHSIDSLLSQSTKKVVQDVQQCLAESKWSSFDATDHTGHWSLLMVRTTRSAEVMAILTFNVQALSQEEIDETKESVRKYFTDGPGKDSKVSSFYFILRKQGQKDPIHDHLFGNKFIQEDLLDLKFRISPDAFFQVNTLAAEVLYSTIADWCKVTPNTTVLDVCCGTGTIGITMAKKAKKIVGIEMVKQATDDARVNAQINGVENAEYYCEKAEDILPSLIHRFGSHDDVVAVVDPPRSGLNYKVIQAIRKAEYVKRLVYVSCNPNGALLNMVDLMRARSNRIKGTPFLPVRAQPVDLFPHTRHCELVILFERQTDEEAG